MYNQRISIEGFSLQPFDLRLPFCDSCHLYRVPVVLQVQGLCEVYQRGASKASLILCLISSRLTITTWDSEQVWDICEWCISVGKKRVLWGNLQWIQKTKNPTLRNISSQGHIQAHRGKRPLLPQQKASHQGLDLITAQQGERPSRQQSCPPAFHPPAINAPCRLTQERPSLALHPPPGSFEDERNWVWVGGTAKRRRGRWNPGCSLWTANHCV